METMEQTAAIPSDLSEAIPLKAELAAMSRAELLQRAEDMGYNVDKRVTDKAIRETILTVDRDRKDAATKVNEESLAKVVDETDPEVTVIFFNMESPGADLDFNYSEPRGMYSPLNKKGHKKCPKYHLFPGERATLPHSVYEHLSSLTYKTHKEVWDRNLGVITGSVPIIKPRFVLQATFTKDQLLKLNK